MKINIRIPYLQYVASKYLYNNKKRKRDLFIIVITDTLTP